jgi:hypothetical protein
VNPFSTQEYIKKKQHKNINKKKMNIVKMEWWQNKTMHKNKLGKEMNITIWCTLWKKWKNDDCEKLWHLSAKVDERLCKKIWCDNETKNHHFVFTHRYELDMIKSMLMEHLYIL